VASHHQHHGVFRPFDESLGWFVLEELNVSVHTVWHGPGHFDRSIERGSGIPLIVIAGLGGVEHPTGGQLPRTHDVNICSQAGGQVVGPPDGAGAFDRAVGTNQDEGFIRHALSLTIEQRCG